MPSTGAEPSRSQPENPPAGIVHPNCRSLPSCRNIPPASCCFPSGECCIPQRRCNTLALSPEPQARACCNLSLSGAPTVATCCIPSLECCSLNPKCRRDVPKCRTSPSECRDLVASSFLKEPGCDRLRLLCNTEGRESATNDGECNIPPSRQDPKGAPAPRQPLTVAT